MSWKDLFAAGLVSVRASACRGVNDAERRDSGEVMVVERARGGAAGAVNGGVVDAGEADRLGGVAEEAGGGRVAGAGRRSDDEDRLSTGVLQYC